MNSTNKKNEPSYAKILTDRTVDNAVCGTLVVLGWEQQDVPDGLGEVRLRAIESFVAGAAVPETVETMRAYCATIARNYAIDCLRKASTDAKYCAGLCEDPDDYAPLLPSGEQRDPVDAGRQLELVADLFRQGRMPEHGLDILEGIASECTYKEVAEDLQITPGAVEGRLRTMRRLFKAKIAERGMG